MHIELRDIHKQFGTFSALAGIDLMIPEGHLTALLGPSGCGKTTLLRIIAGLEQPDRGVVLLDGEDATGRSARDRQVGFVFQHYALFQHMTVFENIAFGLRVRPKATRPSAAVIHDKVHELLNLVQLEWLAGRYPHQLSGGQRQRVALARALAVEPKVLLLDEPFGALDTQVRKELRRWLRRLHDELHVTSVFVTHDQEEALEVADQVVVMNRGKIEQLGNPDDVYQHPASPFVFQFLGSVNLFHGRLDGGIAQVNGLQIESPNHADIQDTPALAYVRPHDFVLSRTPLESSWVAHIRRVRPLGPVVRLEVEYGQEGHSVEVELSRERYRTDSFQVGEVIFLQPLQMRVFPASS